MELTDGFYWIQFRGHEEEGWTVGRRRAGKHSWEVVASDEWYDDADVVVGPYLGGGPEQQDG